MATPDRQVRRLRMAAADDGAARALLPRLQDALRSATLPDTGEQLLLVRRLALGSVAAGASAQTLARCIELRLQAADVDWQDGATDDAVAASHVRFASRQQALEALAARVQRGQPCSAWYWPRLAPGFGAHGDAVQNLAAIERAVATGPRGAQALAAWRAALVPSRPLPRQPALDDTPAAAAAAPDAAATVRRPHPADPAVPTLNSTARMAPLAPDRQVAAPVPPAAPAVGARAPQPAPVPGSVLDVAGRGANDTTAGAPAARLRAADPPTPGPSPASVLPPGRTDAGASLQVRPLAGEIAPTPAARPRRKAPGADGVDPGMRRRGSTRIDEDAVANTLRDPPASAAPGGGPPHRSPTPPPAAVPLPAVNADKLQTDEPWPAMAPRRHAARLPTSHGGLLFLLPVLARLGLPAWAESHDADAVAWTAAVLRCALQRLKAAPDDPWFECLAGALPPPAPATACPGLWVMTPLAPPRGRPRPTLVEAWSDADDSRAQASLWLSACHRWLRRGPGIGLASLLQRRGCLWWSPTHVDVLLPLAAAEMRVRRHGLDIDPGWLPWFGRAVAFHYSDAEDGV